VRLSALGTSATVCPIVPAPDDRWWVWSSRWNENLRRNRNTRMKPVPVPLCPPQIPHDLTWARTRATAYLLPYGVVEHFMVRQYEIPLFSPWDEDILKMFGIKWSQNGDSYMLMKCVSCILDWSNEGRLDYLVIQHMFEKEDMRSEFVWIITMWRNSFDDGDARGRRTVRVDVRDTLKRIGLDCLRIVPSGGVLWGRWLSYNNYWRALCISLGYRTFYHCHAMSVYVCYSFPFHTFAFRSDMNGV
jgi:hypothetical protein